MTEHRSARDGRVPTAGHHPGTARHGLGQVAQDRFGGDHADLTLFPQRPARRARGGGRAVRAAVGIAVLLVLVAAVVRLTRGPLLARLSDAGASTLPDVAGVPLLHVAVGLLCFAGLVALVVRAVR